MVDLDIKPQESVFFWTDIKAYMQHNEVLECYVRSSVGINLDVTMTNTVGIIDSDYYNNPKNNGNIGIHLKNNKPQFKLEGSFKQKVITNVNFLTGVKEEDIIDIPIIKDLTKENTIHIKKGERVAQCIFKTYLESDNCNSENERTGGIGSTNETLDTPQNVQAISETEN